VSVSMMSTCSTITFMMVRVRLNVAITFIERALARSALARSELVQEQLEPQLVNLVHDDEEHLVVLFRLRTRLLQSEQFHRDGGSWRRKHSMDWPRLAARLWRAPRAALARGERLNEIGSSFIADAQYEIPLRSALKGRGDDAIDAVLGRLGKRWRALGKAAAVVVLGQLLALAVFETQVRVQREGAVHFRWCRFCFWHLDQENFGVMGPCAPYRSHPWRRACFSYSRPPAGTSWVFAGFMSLDLEQFEGE